MSSLEILVSFFIYGLLSGLFLSVVCATLGVFVIMKRVAFIGITLSEVAAAGLAGGFLVLHAFAGHVEHVYDGTSLMARYGPLVFAMVATTLAVFVLVAFGKGIRVPQDAVSGSLYAVAGATSVLLVAESTFGMEEIKNLLWGNLLVAQPMDLVIACVILLPIGVLLLVFRSYLTLASTDRDLMTLMKGRPGFWEMGFFYLLGIVVAVGSKIGGSLLVFAYLVIPSSAALAICSTVASSLIVAAVLALVCTVLGLYFSVVWDYPASQLVILLLGASALVCSLGKTVMMRFRMLA